MTTQITTAVDVFSALGGISEVRRLTQATYNQACNWKTKQRFPARTYRALAAALLARGYTADMALWGMPEPAAENQVTHSCGA